MATKATPMYLRGLGEPTASTITLPFAVNKTNYYFIEIDYYFARSSESGSYHHFLSNGDVWGVGGLISNKTWNQFFSGNIPANLALPYVRAIINMSTGMRTCTDSRGASASITRSFDSYTNTASVYVRLNKTSALKELKVWNASRTTLLFDFVPAYDGSNVACLYDTVGGQYYYSADTLEIVSDPTV